MTDTDTPLFAGATFDRAAHLRKEAGDLLTRPDARAAVLWRGKALFDEDEVPRLSWLAPDHPILREAVTPPLFLGLDGEAPRFAYDISPWEDPEADLETMANFVDTSENRHPAMTDSQTLLDLRANMSRLDPTDAGNIAGAKGMFAWHDAHGFCAKCGERTAMAEAGWQRDCPSCGAHHFPRTDPVVIMLILHRGKLLMGRSPGWPETMYSLLAGFMEPGESIEAAVRREVAEEAGIEVGRVGYITSQPWPFPASLMIGCWGEALTDAIEIDPAELEDARWVTKDDIIANRLSETPEIRPARHGSIARFIIDRWIGDQLEIPVR